MIDSLLMDHGIVSPGNRSSGKAESKYRLLRITGSGMFSTVYEAIDKASSETVAIKKIKIELESCNTELEMLSSLSHPNIITLKDFYYTKSLLTKEKYLNIVTEFVPLTLGDVIKHYFSQGYSVPLVLIKFYSFQLLLAIMTLHRKSICHRDIKPTNILIDPKTHQLKLIDFGSAKILTGDCQSVHYVCSRHYRAPELIFGASAYKLSIDMWSFGCVLSELFLGKPIFPGESSVDQLVEIIRVLGTPTREMLREMNEDFTEFRFPSIRTYPFSKVFDGRIEREALEIISGLLVYEPSKRLTPTQALKHLFFRKIHEKSAKLPNGERLPVYVEDAVLFDI